MDEDTFSNTTKRDALVGIVGTVLACLLAPAVSVALAGAPG